MAIAGKRTIQEDKIDQVIDLGNYTDSELSDFEKMEIGQAFIDRIVERSESQRDVNNRRFPAYSQSYKESEDFERYGKSASDRNMTLKGNMLDGIDIELSGDSIRIFMDADQTAKAHGNITGQNGKWGKTRDFFGLSESEVSKIVKQYEPSRDIADRFGVLDVINQSIEQRSARSVFDEIFGSVFGDN